MNEEAKKHKFNLIDAILIVAILAIIAFCGYKAYSYYNTIVKANNNSNELSTNTYICEVELKKISSETKDQLHIGDKVFNINSTELGKIIEINASNAVEEYYDSTTNKYITVTVPNAYNMTITMELNTNPDFIYVGKNLSFKTIYVKANGFILTRESK